MHTDKGKTNTENTKGAENIESSKQRLNENVADCFQCSKNFLLWPVFICVDLRSSVVPFRRSTSKQAVLLAGWFEAEVFIGKSGSNSASNFPLNTHQRSSRISMKGVLCVRN